MLLTCNSDPDPDSVRSDLANYLPYLFLVELAKALYFSVSA
jgi:hypothetical protein